MPRYFRPRRPPPNTMAGFIVIIEARFLTPPPVAGLRHAKNIETNATIGPTRPEAMPHTRVAGSNISAFFIAIERGKKAGDSERRDQLGGMD